eukprot:21467-Heterococcus_DN1.PRE.7
MHYGLTSSQFLSVAAKHTRCKTLLVECTRRRQYQQVKVLAACTLLHAGSFQQVFSDLQIMCVKVNTTGYSPCCIKPPRADMPARRGKGCNAQRLIRLNSGISFANADATYINVAAPHGSQNYKVPTSFEISTVAHYCGSTVAALAAAAAAEQ